jgi:hypothetical protein
VLNRSQTVEIDWSRKRSGTFLGQQNAIEPEDAQSLTQVAVA